MRPARPAAAAASNPSSSITAANQMKGSFLRDHKGGRRQLSISSPARRKSSSSSSEQEAQAEARRLKARSCASSSLPHPHPFFCAPAGPGGYQALQ